MMPMPVQIGYSFPVFFVFVNFILDSCETN